MLKILIQNTFSPKEKGHKTISLIFPNSPVRKKFKNLVLNIGLLKINIKLNV